MADNRAAAFDVTDDCAAATAGWPSLRGPAALHARAVTGKGFRDAMAAAGAGPGRAIGDFSYERGYAATLQMIAEPEPPDAIIARQRRDRQGAGRPAPGAQSVPGRISVAGMTDTGTARFSDMTTVSVPMYQFGAAAAQRIVAGEDPPDETVFHQGAALHHRRAAAGGGGPHGRRPPLAARDEPLAHGGHQLRRRQLCQGG